MSENKLVPYTGTIGDPDTFYCQLDDCELWGADALKDHANELVLKQQAKIDKLEAAKEEKTANITQILHDNL